MCLSQQNVSASSSLGLSAMDKVAFGVYVIIGIVEVLPHAHKQDLGFGNTPTKNSGEQRHGVRL